MLGVLIAAIVWLCYYTGSGNWVVGLDAAAGFLCYWTIIWAIIAGTLIVLLMMGVGGVVGGTGGGVNGGMLGIVGGGLFGLVITILNCGLGVVGAWLLDTSLDGQTTWAGIDQPYFIAGSIMYGLSLLIALGNSKSSN